MYINAKYYLKENILFNHRINIFTWTKKILLSQRKIIAACSTWKRPKIVTIINYSILQQNSVLLVRKKFG